jgi:hypothetical protein
MRRERKHEVTNLHGKTSNAALETENPVNIPACGWSNSPELVCIPP